jgi:hypothetical protein
MKLFSTSFVPKLLHVAGLAPESRVAVNFDIGG